MIRPGDPWFGEERLTVSAAGGMVHRERDVAILARACTDTVRGDARTEISRDFDRTTDDDATLDVKGGTDALEVAGEAEIDFREVGR